MKKKSKRTLTPKLRFPEFRDGGDWQEEVLRESATVIAGQSPRGEYYNDTGNGTPFYQGKTDFGDVFINPPTKWTTQVTRLALADDILMSVRAPVGALNVSTQKICIGRGLAALRAKDDKWFLYYLLLQLNRLFVGNGGSVFDSINKFQIESTKIPLPPTCAEQQKIADCLSSLDGLIAAEGRALEALKAHKKGLMQQLFPREGETTPRLRFPEFQDKGEWENISLGSICQIQRGKFSHRPRNDPKFFGGPYAFIQTGDVVRANGGAVVASQSLNERGLSVSKLFKPTIVLITIAANIGDTAILESEACFTDSVVGLIPKSDRVTPRFLESIMRLKKEHLNQVATTGAQKNINNEILGALTVLVPSIDEQSRIEYCLFSLDNQISAQAAKIESLKTHKRGLMQQLFPAPEEQ